MLSSFETHLSCVMHRYSGIQAQQCEYNAIDGNQFLSSSSCVCLQSTLTYRFSWQAIQFMHEPQCEKSNNYTIHIFYTRNKGFREFIFLLVFVFSLISTLVFSLLLLWSRLSGRIKSHIQMCVRKMSQQRYRTAVRTALNRVRCVWSRSPYLHWNKNAFRISLKSIIPANNLRRARAT